ncbi:hypothetical protein C8F04DRAFT_1189817 [Mycena alexandri]|uniref:Uncharacterized protein n=1 Tax=Mycena alexandri TaxID=1745969 RepID=A0AAD6WZW4_9AGAR|nr:hypothetical protein C8F04DRAFT_1189817 [Mycena alexandri]
MYGMKSWRQPPWMWASRRRRVKRLERGILGKMRSEEAPSAKGGAEGKKLTYCGRARLVLDPKLASPVGGVRRSLGGAVRGVRVVTHGVLEEAFGDVERPNTVERITLSSESELEDWEDNNKSGNNNAYSDPPTGLASPFKPLRRLGDPYKLHYHLRREGSPSPLNSMRSSTGMLHRLNHYKGTPRSPRLINLGIINEGFSPLGMSVDELAAGFTNISMRSASPGSPAERKPAFGETQSSREFNETTGEAKLISFRRKPRHPSALMVSGGLNPIPRRRRRTSALMGSSGPIWTSVRLDSGGLNRIPRRRGRTSTLMGSGVPMWKCVRMDSSEARPLNPRRWTSAPTGIAGLGSTFVLMDSGAALKYLRNPCGKPR